MAEARTLHDLIRAKACLQCVCRRCRHGALLFPMTLGEEHGWQITVDEIAQWLRCSKCFSAHVNVYEAVSQGKVRQGALPWGGYALSTKPDHVRGAFRLGQQRFKPGNILEGRNAPEYYEAVRRQCVSRAVCKADARIIVWPGADG